MTNKNTTNTTTRKGIHNNGAASMPRDAHYTKGRAVSADSPVNDNSAREHVLITPGDIPPFEVDGHMCAVSAAKGDSVNLGVKPNPGSGDGNYACHEEPQPNNDTSPSEDNTNTNTKMTTADMTNKNKKLNNVYDSEIEQASIKLHILTDYIRSKEVVDSLFREASDHTCVLTRETRFADCDREFLHDDDGDLAMNLSCAESMLMRGVKEKHFRCALGLILIVETCYEPTGSLSRLNAALGRFQPLVMRGALIPAALLHEFLEVRESLDTWFSHHLDANKLVRDRDYIIVPLEDCLSENPCGGGGLRTVLLTAVTAEKLACATPTLRGQKVRACLVDPGVHSCDYASFDAILLELLFSPPSRGHSPS